jgi:hypothetical protein
MPKKIAPSKHQACPPGRHGLLHVFFHHEHFTLQILFSNKIGISISYFQNCISVYETFITLYLIDLLV